MIETKDKLGTLDDLERRGVVAIYIIRNDATGRLQNLQDRVSPRLDRQGSREFRAY